MNAQFGFANVEPTRPAAVVDPIPTYALFDSTSVAIATLLGSPVAGTGLMALNYHRLGKKTGAIAAFAIGIAVTGLVMAFGNRIPAYATTGVAVGLVVATMNLAKTFQGAAIQQHVREGGKLGSRWAAAGLGVALLVIIGGGAILFAFEQLGSKVVIGTKDEVHYSGSATKADALILGEALKQAGYFLDQGVTAGLSKGKGGTVVAFVVKDGMWNRADIVSGFEEVGREIAPSIGGFPIKLRLQDTAQETMKELTVGKAVIGTKDEIYYYGTATESEANALGQSLKSAGFFRDSGFNVFLSKGDDGTSIAFVVAEGAWDVPDKVAAFEELVRQCDPAVGGLPVKLRFVNARLETKKETTVN